MVFHRSLGDTKFPQLFRTLLSILVDLNAIAWMVSTPPTSKSSSPATDPLGTELSALIIISLIVTFMFYIFSVL